jgi:hypothetical protein
MKHTWLDNLRLIAEYVFFDDAPALLGVKKRELTAWARGKKTPPAAVQSDIARIAGKMRRRQAQIERIQRAEDERAARRDARATLRLIGKESLPLPEKLPTFLRQYDMGKLASPVFIYDFRDMTANQVMQFFAFMKRAVPQGYYFLTYEVKPGGTSAEGGKKFWNTDTMKVSTTYQPFCVGMGAGRCLMSTDFELMEFWLKVNDPSAKRNVIEIGISYPRPVELTEEEKEYDRERGADPLTGLVYVWQD